MLRHHRIHPGTLLWAALGIFCSLLLGCGPGRGQVSGTVTVRATPLPRGLVTFFPKQGEPYSVAVVDGKYGPVSLLAGDYLVAVRVIEAPGGTAPSKGKPGLMTGPGDSRPAPARKADPLTILPKYGDPTKSELKITINPGENTYDVPF